VDALIFQIKRKDRDERATVRLQIVVEIVLTAIKLDLIGRLRMAGLNKIEATSFVSPWWIPRMEDHSQFKAFYGGIVCSFTTGEFPRRLATPSTNV
jgi:hypothetical protein